MEHDNFDMNSLLELLSPEERRDTINSIRTRALARITDTICAICHNIVAIPVHMTKQVFCDDCGDSSKSIMCLSCVRDWLQLNKRPNERVARKHLICNKIIETRYMNARTSYVVDENLINLLDIHHPRVVECKCSFTGTRRELRSHGVNATCPMSTWKCPACEFRGKPSEYVIHTQSCVRIKSCLGF